MHLSSQHRFEFPSLQNLPVRSASLAMPALVARSDNSSATNDSPYSYGLAGVDQVGNYFFINSLIVFFLGLATVCLAVRVAHNVRAYLRHINTMGAGNEHQTYWTENHSSLWPWLKRHLVQAPLWGKHHNADIKIKPTPKISYGTLPSRYHTFLLAAYVFSNLAYCCVLDYTQQNKPALLAELRGRSGALAVINMIPTVLFALRNNPLIPLLHISFDTFNLFHRWAGRVVVLETIIHVAAWATVSIESQGWRGMSDAISQSESFQWGTVGAVFMLVIAILAWSPIRHAAYEYFLNIHRLLVFFTLLGVYVHLDKAKLPQVPYIQLAAIFWGGEWFCRLTRIAVVNISRQRLTQCTVEALPEQACRVTFNLPRPWKIRPGSHVHAYLPLIGLWSSHPFSVAWTQDQVIREVKRAELNSSTSGTDIELGSVKPIITTRVTHTTVTLIMKAKSGMTRKLYDLASAVDTGILTTHGLIEGPYGGHDSLDSYGTVVLFAAGVGITHQLGYVRHLLQGYITGTVATRKIVLVWAIPNQECLHWIRPWVDEIFAMDGRQEAFKFLVYLSKSTLPPTVSTSGSVHLISGRCKIYDIVDFEFANRVGAMAVTVCGPGTFADDVRDAVRGKMELGAIDLVEESFTY